MRVGAIAAVFFTSVHFIIGVAASRKRRVASEGGEGRVHSIERYIAANLPHGPAIEAKVVDTLTQARAICNESNIRVHTHTHTHA